MIRSMTGFGAAQIEAAGFRVRVEAKSVNGRFFKLSLRLPPSLNAQEHEIEGRVRKTIRRGSLNVTIDVRDERPAARVGVDESVVRAYQEIFRRLAIPEAPLATLPGVLTSRRDELDEAVLAATLSTTDAAIKELIVMREREGAALAQSIANACDKLATLVAHVKERGPAIVQEQQQKLTQRLQTLVPSFGTLPVDPQLVAREIAIFADRCDVNEEVERLTSHLAQIRDLLRGGDEAGRTLDFLSQELLREINTIGSKSADAELIRLVVQMKAETERFKEQIANVE